MEKLCSLDWPTLAAFAIVVLTVVATTFLTIRNQNLATAAQRQIADEAGRRQIQLAEEAGRRQIQIAHEAATREQEKLRAVAIADARRAWIGNLRDEASSFIAETYSMWDLHQQKVGRADTLRDLNNPSLAMAELGQWSIRYGSARTAMERSRAKVALLLNPQEEATQRLLAAIDRSMSKVKGQEDPHQLNLKVIELLQPVLKEEWSRVKTLDLA